MSTTPTDREIQEDLRRRLAKTESDLKLAYTQIAAQARAVRGAEAQARALQEQLDRARQRIQDMAPVVDAARQIHALGLPIAQSDEDALMEAVTDYEAKADE